MTSFTRLRRGIDRFGPVAVTVALLAGVAAGCEEGQTPTGNAHLNGTAPDFPAYASGLLRLVIQGSETGTYEQAGWFFLDEGIPAGPASEQWGGFYSNDGRAGVQVDTLVQILGWGPLPEGRRTIQPVRLGDTPETAPYAALAPFLYAHPVSFTLLPFNFEQPDAPLVYVTSGSSYIHFELIDLPEIDPVFSRGVGGQIRARLRIRMQGYRPIRTDTGTRFHETAEFIEVLGSLDLPVVRSDLGADGSNSDADAEGADRTSGDGPNENP